MFTPKGKEIATTKLPLTAENAIQAKRAKSIPSLISADATIVGTLHSEGDVQIEGRVEGDVHAIGLVIADQAQIHGEIHAEMVTVRGTVVGRIRARKIVLCATGRIEGDILHASLAVELGGFFDGNCQHSDDPLAMLTHGLLAEQLVRQGAAPAPAKIDRQGPSPALATQAAF